MQVVNSDEPTPKPEETLDSSKNSESSDSPATPATGDDELVVDVSGKSMDFSAGESSVDENCDDESVVRALYLYKNSFNLIPKSVGSVRRLRTLKFFGNEINLFSPELGSLAGLENLQVRISSPGFGGLELNKLKGLKELELAKVPQRPSAFPILSEIASLKCLTRLSVCHFSIRYLPSEIGCLKNLEYLDLSFNKIKSLPTGVSKLIALVSLKVSNNKLVEIPPELSLLQNLESLDLSNNRLTSLGSIELGLMHKLQNLNLQNNKLLEYVDVPSWISCNMQGTSNENSTNSSVEMDVYDNDLQEYNERLSCKEAHHSLPPLVNGASSNNRCFGARKSGKRWKRRYYLQQRARQERLNSSRMWKCVDHSKLLPLKEDENCQTGSDVLPCETCEEETSEIIGLDDDDDDKEIHSPDNQSENLSNSNKDDAENCSSVIVESSAGSKGDTCDGFECNKSLASFQNDSSEDEESSSEIKNYSKSKRHSDKDLDNPKPCKSRRAIDNSSRLSRKYNKISLCTTEDFLPDGFYDAGRDRPFMPLRNYEQSSHLDSREVIIADRGQDEELDAIVISAQSLIFRLRQLNCVAKDGDWVNELQVASLLALFVSDHFGGSDRAKLIEQTRKAVSGSNYQKPFVCTCSTGNRDNISTQTEKTADSVEDVVFSDICEKSLRGIKAKRNSIIVPLGTLQFGMCRHRAILMKYLCDRVEPPILCELVRGYIDFMPHAWNIILVKRGDSFVRMVVDACHPHDIREETDPEYYCRYIPLCRSKILPGSKIASGSSFPSLSFSNEILKAASSSLIRCKFGVVEAAAKVRTIEVCKTSAEDCRKFEYECLGEVRLLGALQHPCIVEMYGHRISTKWILSADGNPERRVLQSAILMEYVKGGSLKGHIEKLSKAGEKHVPLKLALFIARDVASALLELHSKDIIHRDIKSENILIDLDGKKADGTPIVKLCDFDRAVPVRSSLHTCCIAHAGIPPSSVCVGTPRWMAPEVLRAMHERNVYGMEIDVWSFGCLLLEMLTLRIPYTELSEGEILDHLQSGKRPQLTEELEGLRSSSQLENARSSVEEDEEEKDAEVDTLPFLVDLFHRCTQENPMDRPTAKELYDMLFSQQAISPVKEVSSTQ